MGMSFGKTFCLPFLPWVSVHPQRQRPAPRLNEALLLLRLAVLFVYSSSSRRQLFYAQNMFRLKNLKMEWKIWGNYSFSAFISRSAVS